MAKGFTVLVGDAGGADRLPGITEQIPLFQTVWTWRRNIHAKENRPADRADITDFTTVGGGEYDFSVETLARICEKLDLDFDISLKGMKILDEE